MPAAGPPVRPTIRAGFHVDVVPGEAVAFVSENGSALVHDPVSQHAVALFDGIRTSYEIAELLRGVFRPDDVHAALAGLARAGLIVEAAGIPTATAALWSQLGVAEGQLPPLLAGVTIGLLGLTATPHAIVTEPLADWGLMTTPAVDACTLLAVSVDDYLDPRLADVDAWARTNGRAWIPVKPTGLNAWVGPVFTPGRGACWTCLAERLLRNRPVERYLAQRGGRAAGAVPGAADPRLVALHASSLLSTQIARWLARAPGATPPDRTLLVFEPVRPALSTHVVARRPQCPACGRVSAAVPPLRPPALDGDRRPIVGRDGGERFTTPEAVFARYAHLISPLTGVVAWVRPAPGIDGTPIHAYTAGLNHALVLDTPPVAANTLRLFSGGKGRSDAQARTGALCEALERYSGVYTGTEPAVRSTLSALGDAAIDLRTCMLYSERQYDERDAWLARGSGFHTVPRRFDPEMTLDYSPIWSITHQTTRYLPTSYLYYGYPHDEERFVAWADSNGNAAGATLAEACLQGLYEVIERDTVAVWWYNRIPRPRVDLTGLDPAWLAELETFYAQRDREFWLLELTDDLQVPTYAAVSRRTDGPSEDIIFGFGAHHDPLIAAARALTEMNQFMPAVLDRDADGRTRYGITDAVTVQWWREATLAAHPHLGPAGGVEPAALTGAEPASSASAGERFDAARAGLEARGFEVLMLDQTRPDIGLPVVKIVVPGLRHHLARLAPGRLYDVPVELGWLARPLQEKELNPVAMFV
jgi:ribosomal protein S12 methylthiotransferase accessory factor